MAPGAPPRGPSRGAKVIQICFKSFKAVKKIISTALKYLIPLAIGLGLIYFLYKNVDAGQMRAVLAADVNYLWFLPVIVVSVLSHVFRACRWRLQLRAIGVEAPLSAVINSIFGTYAVNLIFPRLGEVWRTGYIASRQSASFTTVLGSMVADRLTDTVTVLVLTVVTFFVASDAFWKFLSTYPQMLESVENLLTSPWTWVCAVVCVAAVWWLFTHKANNPVVAKVKGMAANLWRGFSGVAKMEGKWWFLLYTALIWGCYFMQLYIATFAFTFTSDLGLVATLVLFVLSSIGMGVPTNGGLGAWHVAIIFGLSLYGVGTFDPSCFDTNASAFAMLVWGVQALLLIVLGVFAFSYMAIDRRRIRQGKTVVKSSGQGGMSL